MKNYLKYHMPWQFLMLALFIQSSTSKINLPDFGIDWFDKILHFSVFGLLGLLIARGFRHSDNRMLRQKYVCNSLLVAIIYSAFDEIHQAFVPGRFTSMSDLIADILGIIVFIWIYYKRRHFIRLKDKKSGQNRAMI